MLIIFILNYLFLFYMLNWVIGANILFNSVLPRKNYSITTNLDLSYLLG